MKRILTFIFSFLAYSSMGQITDDFSDGDFLNDPAWSGSTGNFIVNSNYQLQLNAAVSGESYLSTPVSFNFQAATEWRFFIRQDFAPSTSNYTKVYLSADQSDLSQPLNGYFLRFGEALSNDAIELFRQDGTTISSVCRGTDGRIANSFATHVKIIRDSLGNWKLFVDYNGGSNFNFETEGTDSTYQSAFFAGIKCLYTSGNINKFYYDDFYFGPEILDTIPPIISSIEATTDSTLKIIYSEMVDEVSATSVANYSINNSIGQPVLVTRDSLQPLLYHLKFSNKFPGGVQLELNVSGVNDLSQNEILVSPLSFVFIPLANAKINDIVFTEVYFAPSANSPLPNAEYIEIFNRNDSVIDLQDWILSDGSTDGILSGFKIGPNEYALLCDCDDVNLFTSLPNVHCLQSFPSLNNSGDQIRITDAQGVLIDELHFDAGMYADNNKDDGGWSLERVDVEFVCVNPGNWRASVSSFHGTPSGVNSVNGIFADNDAPFISNAYLTDSFSLVIKFSEEVSSNAGDFSNYKITLDNGDRITSMQSIELFGDSAVILFSAAIPTGTHTLQISSEIHDCPGNSFLTFQTKRFGYAAKVSSGDIVINEIMFYSHNGSNDFVELYNRSDKIVDLKDWIINETDSQFTEIKETAKICSYHKLFFPGEYIVLTEEQEKIKSFYYCEDPYSFIDVKSMPDFSSSDGGVLIADNFGNPITAIAYSDDMHFPLIKETRGVSLERLSFNDESNNWHSAAATAGFATPGYVNSQSIGNALGDGGFSLSSEIISPDGDGYCDVLAVHYRCEQPGSVLSLNVFSSAGLKVRTLLAHQTINLEGDLFWDGLSDNQQQLPQGFYILLAEGFDLNGNNYSFKKSVFLTRNIN